MSDGHQLVITQQGLEAANTAKNRGLKAELKWCSVGDASYTPSKNQKVLVNELDRVEFGEYKEMGGGILQAVAKFSGPKEYAVGEIGFWLDDGTLFGVISVPDKILNFKSKTGSILQPFTLNLSDLPSDSVSIVVGTENLNILIDQEMMSDAVAFTRSQASQVKQLLAYMKLSDKVHMLEKTNV